MEQKGESEFEFVSRVTQAICVAAQGRSGIMIWVKTVGCEFV